MAAGVIGVLRHRRQQRDLAAVVDSVMFVLVWVGVIATAVGDASMSPAHRLVLVACPIADVPLIALVTRLLGRHDRDPAIRWITLSLGFVLVCDLCGPSAAWSASTVPDGERADRSTDGDSKRGAWKAVSVTGA